jgi:hypothetical protein
LVRLEKKMVHSGIKVIGRSAVLASTKLIVLEEGQEIASNQNEIMYLADSDWSEADPLVQQICQVVFQTPS